MGGAGVSWLELISVIAGLTCVVMAGRNNKYNFWVGYLYNILLFILFLQRHLYSAAHRFRNQRLRPLALDPSQRR